jgi:hypothetical protein
MTTNYQKGAVFEHYVKKRLQKEGYYVMRSSGSHSTIDLCAVGKENVLLIQCKFSSVETIPDIKQLLSRVVVIRSEESLTSGMFIGVVDTFAKSNVKLLEEMDIPSNASKIIIWKGVGRNNIFHFLWNGKDWKVKKGWIV